MLRYRHVLIAFDGSPESALVLEHAVALAHVTRARLAIVALAPRPAWSVRDALEAQLRAAADGVPDDLEVTTRLLEGDPAHELLRAAREGDHDAIILGANGFADRVVHDAAVPVILIHSPGEGPDLAA
ncbi:universal stress protein family protein [Solirubrobacter pauli]|uniref:Universal stress protein family protein n=1 Tax=Solirubrobacter pauli TaxID=166793 RepID=A0A660LBQ9_9ACTN|nr:universal stress protein [Solirubrobacter pauli]RKQ91836.1 universal stress protein family protein [Solirubrobacter pauli]